MSGSGYADMSELEYSCNKTFIVPTYMGYRSAANGKLFQMYFTDKDSEAECIDSVKTERWVCKHDKVDETTGFPPKVAGDFEVYNTGQFQKAKNNGVNTAEYTTFKLAEDTADLLLTRELNYHPDGEQLFYPHFESPGPNYWGLLLAEPCNKYALKPEHCAFYVFDDSDAVILKTGVWHQPPVICTAVPENEKVIFTTCQAATHACVTHDSIKISSTTLAVNADFLFTGGGSRGWKVDVQS